MFITLRCTPFQSLRANKVTVHDKHVLPHPPNLSTTTVRSHFHLVIPLTPVASPASASHCKPVTKLLSPQHLSSQILFVSVSSLTHPCSHSKCKIISPYCVLGCINASWVVVTSADSFISNKHLPTLNPTILPIDTSFLLLKMQNNLYLVPQNISWTALQQTVPFSNEHLRLWFDLTLFVICPA